MQIKVDNISFVYNPKDPKSYKALDGVSLEINQGEFVAIVGKTGSGKSTLVQTFNGLIFPTEGCTRVDKFVVTGDKKLFKTEMKQLSKEDRKKYKNLANLRKKVGMVFQFPEYQLFSDTVLKDVMFGPKNFGMNEEESKKNSIEALNSVGIPESYFEKSPFELSGGEKRRVAIAGILASDPDVIVLDEPTAGLDPNGKKEIMTLIAKLHENGKTIILVTHDMDVVLNYATKVIVLHDAKLSEIALPSELFKKNDLSEYSLEVPTLYKFINLLKYRGFARFFEDVSNFEDLINAICEVKKWAKHLENIHLTTLLFIE